MVLSRPVCRVKYRLTGGHNQQPHGASLGGPMPANASMGPHGPICEPLPVSKKLMNLYYFHLCSRLTGIWRGFMYNMTGGFREADIG